MAHLKAAALTRPELLRVLDTMGVTIPSTSKLPDDALEKRLKQAISASEALASVALRPPIPLAQYGKWPVGESSYEAIRRGDIREAMLNKMDMNDALHKNPFLDVRQTLMSLAIHWDQGSKVAIMQDPKKEKSAVNIRVVDVLKFDDQTPVLVVLYKFVTHADPMPGIRWIQELQGKEGFVMQNITSTVLEQKFMLKILNINSKFVPPDFAPARLASEADFHLSFLLPMGPLSFEDRGKLNLDHGCAICGKKTVSRCSQCQSVSYCGAECQKADWNTHKKTCRSLKGGTWLTIPIANGMPGHEGLYSSPVNRFNFSTNLADRVKKIDEKQPPENAHGDKLFLIKLQIAGPVGSSHFLIYDRQRSMDVFYIEQKDPDTFRKFRDEVQGPRGGYFGMKMYRWAKRISEWELSVCLDRQPQEEIKW